MRTLCFLLFKHILYILLNTWPSNRGIGELSFFANKQVIANMLNPDTTGREYGLKLADLTFDLFQTPLQDMIWMA